MRSQLSRFWHDEAGLATVEYALLLALVAIGGIAAWTALGRTIKTQLLQMSNSLANPPN